MSRKGNGGEDWLCVPPLIISARAQARNIGAGMIVCATGVVDPAEPMAKRCSPPVSGPG